MLQGRTFVSKGSVDATRMVMEGARCFSGLHLLQVCAAVTARSEAPAAMRNGILMIVDMYVLCCVCEVLYMAGSAGVVAQYQYKCRRFASVGRHVRCAEGE